MSKLNTSPRKQTLRIGKLFKNNYKSFWLISTSSVAGSSSGKLS